MRDKESEIIKMIGEKEFSRYVNFAFEYAVREASFLQLAKECDSQEDYLKSFNNLCVLRRSYLISELYDIVEEMDYLYPGRPVHITLIPEERIDALIHKQYYSSTGRIKILPDIR